MGTGVGLTVGSAVGGGGGGSSLSRIFTVADVGLPCAPPVPVDTVTLMEPVFSSTLSSSVPNVNDAVVRPAGIDLPEGTELDRYVPLVLEAKLTVSPPLGEAGEEVNVNVTSSPSVIELSDAVTDTVLLVARMQSRTSDELSPSAIE